MIYLKIGIVALAISAVVTIPILINKLHETKQNLKQVESYIENKDRQIEYYRTERNKEIAKTNATVMAFDAFKRVASDRDLAFVREFEGVKRNLKNLEQITNLNTKTIANMGGTLRDTTVVIDSIETPAFSFDIKDEWIHHTGQVVPSTKNITIISEVNVPIQGVIYWQRPKLFGFGPRWFTKKQYKTELSSPNPHTTITQADQILIRKR